MYTSIVHECRLGYGHHERLLCRYLQLLFTDVLCSACCLGSDAGTRAGLRRWGLLVGLFEVGVFLWPDLAVCEGNAEIFFSILLSFFWYLNGRWKDPLLSLLDDSSPLSESLLLLRLLASADDRDNRCMCHRYTDRSIWCCLRCSISVYRALFIAEEV